MFTDLTTAVWLCVVADCRREVYSNRLLSTSSENESFKHKCNSYCAWLFNVVLVFKRCLCIFLTHHVSTIPHSVKKCVAQISNASFRFPRRALHSNRFCRQIFRSRASPSIWGVAFINIYMNHLIANQSSASFCSFFVTLITDASRWTNSIRVA